STVVFDIGRRGRVRVDWDGDRPGAVADGARGHDLVGAGLVVCVVCAVCVVGAVGRLRVRGLSIRGRGAVGRGRDAFVARTAGRRRAPGRVRHIGPWGGESAPARPARGRARSRAGGPEGSAPAGRGA